MEKFERIDPGEKSTDSTDFSVNFRGCTSLDFGTEQQKLTELQLKLALSSCSQPELSLKYQGLPKCPAFPMVGQDQSVVT